jgi:hypothetical protein
MVFLIGDADARTPDQWADVLERGVEGGAEDDSEVG